jgi:steroid delta-isomerase-like uncharacterized protein
MTTPYDAAAIGRRFFSEQDRLRGGPAPELCAPGYQAIIGSNPPMSRDGHEMFAKAFYGAFPDMQHTVDEAFADADGTQVAVRFTIRGTHQAPFMGIPATHQAVAVTANVLMHVSNGAVTRLYGAFDEAGLLRQLGVLNA